jgi:hypothetical protein
MVFRPTSSAPTRPRAIALAAVAVSLLASLVGAQHAAAVFPGADGRIASTDFSSEPSRIISSNPDGSSPLTLTGGLGSAAYPMYSPDGRQIAFEGDNWASVMNADGSGRVALGKGSTSYAESTTWIENYEVPGAQPPRTIPWVKKGEAISRSHAMRDPAFTPDGAHLIAAESDFEEVERAFCAVKAEGDEDCIPESEPGFYFNFESACPKCSAHLVLLDATSGAVTGQVTGARQGFVDREPAYAGNGALAFRRRDIATTAESILTIASPGAPPIEVPIPGTNTGPEISPDGSRIAFIHDAKEIATVSFAGGPLTVLPMPPIAAPYDEQFPSDPAYSPDGTQLAFGVYQVKSGTETAQRALYVIGADGSGVHRIGVGTSPGWQPIPIPPPLPALVKSTAKGRKGKVRLDKKDRAKVGTLTCGSAACSLKIGSAKLKAGKRSCGATIKLARKLAAGASAQATAVVKGRCLVKLQEAGKGRLTVKVTIAGANGIETLTFSVTLLPPKKRKH